MAPELERGLSSDFDAERRLETEPAAAPYITAQCPGAFTRTTSDPWSQTVERYGVAAIPRRLLTNRLATELRRS